MDNLELFLQIYDALTPENQARLAALLEEVARSQEVSADSLPTEKETTY